MSPRRARALVLLAAVLFSTGGAAIKTDAFTAAQVSAVRSGIAALTLLLWMRFLTQREAAAAPRPSIPVRLVAGAVYAAMLTLYVAATKLTTAANAIFLQATAPLYLLVLAPLVLGEHFRKRDLGFIAAFAGGLIFCVAGGVEPTGTAPNPALGNLLGAATGFLWALTLVVLRYVGRADTSARGTLAAVALGNAMACAVALPAALPMPAAPAGEWLTLGYLGVFQIGLAYVALSTAVSHVRALDASLLLLLEPVLNPVWTWLVRGEAPGTWTIVGGAVIVAATALKIIADARD